MLSLQEGFHHIEHFRLDIGVHRNEKSSPFFDSGIVNLRLDMLKIRNLDSVEFIKLGCLFFEGELIFFSHYFEGSIFEKINFEFFFFFDCHLA